MIVTDYRNNDKVYVQYDKNIIIDYIRLNYDILCKGVNRCKYTSIYDIQIIGIIGKVIDAAVATMIVKINPTTELEFVIFLEMDNFESYYIINNRDNKLRELGI